MHASYPAYIAVWIPLAIHDSETDYAIDIGLSVGEFVDVDGFQTNIHGRQTLGVQPIDFVKFRRF